MNVDDQINAVERNIRSAKADVSKAKALEKLHNNKEFKELILEGYLKENAIRLVHLKADPSMQTAEGQASVLRQMDSIGELMGYFQVILHQAKLSEKNVAEFEADLADLHDGIM